MTLVLILTVIAGLTGQARSATARQVQLTVGVKPPRAVDGETFKNKTAPLESQLGWKQAAEDIAKQIEKWIADRRVAIVAAR